MATYLLNWNPDKWDGWRSDELEAIKVTLKAGATSSESWSTGRSKRLVPGDRVYWLRLGVAPTGIFAAGRAVSHVQESEHWDESRAAEGSLQRSVDVEIDELLNPWSEPILSQNELERQLPDVHWSPQASGVQITGNAEIELAKLWHRTLAQSEVGPLPPVTNPLQIRENLQAFTRAMKSQPTDLVELFAQSTYFVYDPVSDEFAPSKWSAFRGMTGESYLGLRRLESAERARRGFNGGRATKIIEGVVDATYRPDPELVAKLAAACQSYSNEESNRDWSNAEFVRLPAIDLGTQPPTSINMEQTNDLNIIYYGPPGTGKTYVTAQRAVEIVDGEVPDDRSELMKRYKELREKEQIDFVTFHQSYSYEEFVEGIRPVLVDEDAEAGTAGNENSMVRYECRPGIFRRICERAEVVGKKTVTTFELDPTKTKVWKMSLGSTQSSEEEWVYDDAIENQRILLGWGEAIDFAGCDTLDAVSERYLGSADAPPKEFAIRAVDRFKNKIANGDLVVVSDGNTKFRAIGRVTGEYYYTGKDDYAQARSVEWLLIFDESQSSDLILKKIFSQATVYELKPKVLKLEGLRDVLSSETPSDPRRYVLIIDEINRGNIAKILGELITLLEPDKRIGAPNELRAELPYSGSSFGVPANLHVIGTMNTADRSIALLDTALRRRFRFIEKMPDPAIVADLVGEAGIVDGVDVGKLLTAINQRIELLYDRDHTLGHAYLLSVESLADLRRIFLERVIPLLQEYFYDDWAKISLVLGCPFHEAKTKNPAPLLVAEELSVEKILGDVDGYETEARFQVNPSFVSAEASGLRQFFNEVIRTGQR